jgi:hypothetical protein
MAQLRKAGSTLVYRCAKQHSEPGGDRRGPRADSDGPGAGRTLATGQGARRASHYGLWCAWVFTGQFSVNSARTCAPQTLTGALPVGGADRPNLQGVPVAAPHLRRPTMRSIGASTGECSKQRFRRAAGVGLRALQAQNQLASSGLTIFFMALPATVQTAEIGGFWVPNSVPYFVSCD